MKAPPGKSEMNNTQQNACREQNQQEHQDSHPN